MNRYMFRRSGRRASRGAALVEMAIVVVLFFVLVFAIIEFARAIFSWGVAVETTRAAARYAIVHAPLATPPTCPGGADVEAPAIAFDDCTCPPDKNELTTKPECGVIHAMCLARHALVTEQANVHVTYRCSSTGNPDAPTTYRPYEVQVQVGTWDDNGEVVDGFEHHFSAIWGLLGFGDHWNVPPFEATRLSEDLETQSP